MKEWEQWLKEYSLPNDVHWYKLNGKLITDIGNQTYYTYVSDKADILVNGIRLREDDTKEEIHHKIANAILRIQIDLAHPKSYKNFSINGKNVLIS